MHNAHAGLLWLLISVIGALSATFKYIWRLTHIFVRISIPGSLIYILQYVIQCIELHAWIPFVHNEMNLPATAHQSLYLFIESVNETFQRNLIFAHETNLTTCWDKSIRANSIPSLKLWMHNFIELSYVVVAGQFINIKMHTNIRNTLKYISVWITCLLQFCTSVSLDLFYIPGWSLVSGRYQTLRYLHDQWKIKCSCSAAGSYLSTNWELKCQDREHLLENSFSVLLIRLFGMALYCVCFSNYSPHSNEYMYIWVFALQMRMWLDQATAYHYDRMSIRYRRARIQ